MLGIENVVELSNTPKQRNETISFVVEQTAAFNTSSCKARIWKLARSFANADISNV